MDSFGENGNGAEVGEVDDRLLTDAGFASHRMYESNDVRTSTAPQNRQLIVHYY